MAAFYYCESIVNSQSSQYIETVPLEKAYRLLNHGPTVLVSSQHGQTVNVMSAAWACALDFAPPKVTIVIDKNTKTRQLVEASGYFALQVPTAAQAKLTHTLGHISMLEDADKLAHAGAALFYQDGFDMPLVAGCAGWLVCKVIPEPHNQQTYDLFIGEVLGAWADSRVFHNGHWQFEQADPALRSLHYIAGGHFYAIGDSIEVD